MAYDISMIGASLLLGSTPNDVSTAVWLLCAFPIAQ